MDVVGANFLGLNLHLWIRPGEFAEEIVSSGRAVFCEDHIACDRLAQVVPGGEIYNLRLMGGEIDRLGNQSS